MRLIGITIYLFFCFTMSSQKDLTIRFVHKAGNEILKLDETEFTIWNGKKMMINRIEFYLSGIKVIDQENEVQKFDDVILLINASQEGRAIPIGAIEEDMVAKKFAMSFGLDSITNHGDPSLYPDTHPLSLKIPSMHWSWAGGYRFFVVEGKVDQDGDGILETDFGFHNLGDKLYKEVQIELDSSANDMNLVFAMDYVKLFDKLTLIGNSQIHGSGAKNLQMMTNATTGGFVNIDKTITHTISNSKSNQYFNIYSSSEGIRVVISELIGSGHRIYIHDMSGKIVKKYEDLSSNTELYLSKNELRPEQIYIISMYQHDEVIQNTKISVN